ncbi:hypothetical protein BDV3_002541 [Batrachochytrium dendrobatidis]|uniref:SUI1 domain-containing protein n=1 Tax=Batrachochytrium dendrobatidis (strain JEL423) TaxID=403673 RepID=A0A177WV27_BATDL|nr:hypothetical protein BDEG_27232 [Batrachochytrium dendrobatidis JEL423]
MFKKPFTIKSQTLLRSSDIRKLRSRVVEQFSPYATCNTTDIASVLFGTDKSTPITAVRIVTHAGRTVTLYVVNSIPILFVDTVDSLNSNRLDEVLFPTVYALWRGVQIGCFFTPKPVLDRLFNGADLMMPGVISHSGDNHPFHVGTVMGVCGHGSLTPLVVGTALISSHDLDDAFQKESVRGKALHTCHTYGDELWAYGGSLDPPVELNLSMSDQVKKVQSLDSLSEQSLSIISNTDAIDTVQQLTLDKLDGWTLLSGDSESDLYSLVDSEFSTDLVTNTHVAKENLEQPTSENNESLVEPVQVAECIKENDRLMQTAFMTAAIQHAKKTPHLLPISGSTFYSNYVLPSREWGTTLDIKKTSFKKLSKYYKTIEKEGMIKTKEQAGEIRITFINFSHSLFEGFEVPCKLAGNGRCTNETSQLKKSESETSTVSHSSKQAGGKLSFTNLYMPPKGSSIIDLFQEVNKIHPLPKYMTAHDIRQAIDAYAVENNLVDVNDKRYIKFDILLYDAVRTKNEDAAIANDRIRRDIIQERIISKLNKFYQLKIGDVLQPVKKGVFPMIQISIEKRSKSKSLTCVLNLQHYTDKLQDIAHELRLKCSASVSVNGTPIAPEMIVQGSKAYEVCQTLHEMLGIPIPPGLVAVRSGMKPKPCENKFIKIT